MSRGFRSFLVVSLSIGVIYSLFKIRSLSIQNQNLANLNQDIEYRLDLLEKKTGPTDNSGPTKLQEILGRIQRLQRRIATQTDAVSAAQKRLDDERGGNDAATDLAGMRDRMERERQVISDLQAQLKDVRDQEAAINGQGRSDISDQNSGQKQENDQINSQISQGIQNINQLKTQLAAVKQAYGINQFDLESAAKVKSLQAQIANQNAALQALRDKRSVDNSQWTYQKGAVRSQSQQELGDLGARDRDLSEQLEREKESLHGMEADMSSGARSDSTRQSLAKAAEADLRARQARLAELQSRLQAAQNSLQALQQNQE